MMIMQARNIPKATVFVIFGDGSDLTWRKLIPALYNLFLDRWCPSISRFWGWAHPG